MIKCQFSKEIICLL